MEINNNTKCDTLLYQKDLYFLCMKTCSLVSNFEGREFHYDDSCDSHNSMTTFNFIYPNQISLGFDLLDEKILLNKEEIFIGIEKNCFMLFSYFIKFLEAEDNIFSIEPNLTFEILKYLNIFRIKRNHLYMNFIKSLTFHSVMFKEEAFSEKTAEIFLDYSEYNNLFILDMIEYFCKFYFLPKYFIDKTFHKYSPNRLFFRRKLHKKRSIFRNMQIEGIELEIYKYFLNSRFRSIWQILIKIFYLDKLYLDLYTIFNDTNMDIIVSSLPPKPKKITLLVEESHLPIFDKLHKINYFKSKKTVKLIVACDTKYILERIEAFKNQEKLILIFNKIEMKELVCLESSPTFESIKYVKIRFIILTEILSKVASASFQGNRKNIYIDFSENFKISDSENNLYELPTYNFKDYIIGISLKLCKQNYELIDFKKLFHPEYITRLNLDLKNVENNSLSNYFFLESFKALSTLYLSNIKLTGELLKFILRSKELIFVWFKYFVFDENLTCENLDFINKSVIHMEFYDITHHLNIQYYYFITRFIALRYLLVCLSYSPDVAFKSFLIEDNMIDASISRLKKPVLLPNLCCFKYTNEVMYQNSSKFSSLHIFSFFVCFNFLEKLVYDADALHLDDIDIIENIKTLKCLKLCVFKIDIEFNILEKILRSNIRKTVSKLQLYVNEFTSSELFSILSFKNLKFLRISAMNFEERNKKYIDLLTGMNLINFVAFI
ncbi:hypothetical protein CWI37_0270p0010 [Hamiltosporidium tvaerminnensis]|uniref:Uncharacterized protein n=1 Tax=Hamiltosporidium tvaerminnensis TaxID=1176355 RepID=A0A4V2JVI3_9MICR|nr:hypothetical protein CWI37_0270p0010 [Hamiltosporidium tvaerminnensis]